MPKPRPARCRYNLSVKKQGASGEGAFIISPLNGLSNEAAPLPSPLQELTGTQIRIPVSALPAGKYEIQMQGIDRWFTTSDFTTPLVVENPAQTFAVLAATHLS